MTSQAAICPLCGQADASPREISVCRACHNTITRSSNASLRATGEFTVDQLVAGTSEQAARPAPPSAEAEGLSCTWCGKRASQVKKLLSHGGANICNGCVALCAEILRAELGEDWGS